MKKFDYRVEITASYNLGGNSPYIVITPENGGRESFHPDNPFANPFTKQRVQINHFTPSSKTELPVTRPTELPHN